jgi:hypothetical protein
MPRRYTITDPESHGTHALVRYYLHDQPDTLNGRNVRRYGRAMMRCTTSQCDHGCAEADASRARLNRMHTNYHRRNR